ncbi:hypothetical protein PtA15_18A296 [Puccinia triticina]|uniref:Stress response RCI peptide n=1 Tax=Puccinia triticina TaxID=208348 RepID=A0ABY7D9G3_9BASI|nr:uncharacterized protein PtA15_18A296 [Puccinia triticina]WAQ93238.1 hypothetical protein PtA15_18A296 [Puccinia triticina]
MADGIKIHRRHGFYVLVMVVGWVLPPVAVLLRFGFGTDFLLNILLTLCGYIPGHGHNFYLQNIRNNENQKRTPKWATKAGLVKDHSAARRAKTHSPDDRSVASSRPSTRHDPHPHRHTLPAVLGPSAPVARRKTSQTVHIPSSSRGAQDDPYFVRRAASIHAPSSAHPKPGDPPAAARSLSQRLGLGGSKKAARKSRFDVANEARCQWQNLPHPRPDTPVAEPAGPDGLDHQF